MTNAAGTSAWSPRLRRPAYRLDKLPDGVALGPGRLTVEFEGAEDLLAKLYELAQTVAGDFEEFKAVVEDTASRKA